LTAQTADTLKKTRYGLEISQFITGSGFASGTELFITVIPNYNMNLSLGIYYCTETKRISGFTVHHERVLIRNSEFKTFVPYGFYNLIYRDTKIREVLANKDYQGDYVGYASIEHHFGIGIRYYLAKNLNVNCAFGYGVYLGSIKKPSEPNPVTNEITGTNGFGFITKIGIAVIL
jgi:hypothetical protein